VSPRAQLVQYRVMYHLRPVLKFSAGTMFRYFFERRIMPFRPFLPTQLFLSQSVSKIRRWDFRAQNTSKCVCGHSPRPLADFWGAARQGRERRKREGRRGDGRR